MSCDDLKATERAFLDRYNCDPADDKGAAQDALSSASQHNSLYREGVLEQEKNAVREYWTTLLREFAAQYKSRVSISRYEADIEELKERMNGRFRCHFRGNRHPRYGYEPGFRISHAQKSLSVFLKYLWCMGKIEIPPQCPVDSIILQRAGLRYPMTRWAYVNSIDEHRRKIECLTRCAETSGLALAEWELITFQNH